MTEGRIIRFTKRTPDGEQAEWFEIEVDYGGKPHRSSDHTYKTEAEARAAASQECDEVDPELHEREL